MNENSTKDRKRILNFRSFLFMAACMIIAIFFGWLFFVNAFVSLLLFTVFALVLAFLCIRFFINRNDIPCKENNIVNRDDVSRKENNIKLIALVVAFILSVFTYCAYINEVTHWQPVGFENGKVYNVSGSVDSNTVRNGNRIIVISDLTLNKQSVKGKLRIYVKEKDGKMEFAREGDIIGFSATVTLTDIYKNYRSGQRYYSRASQSDMNLTFGKPSFLQNVRTKMKNTLTDNLSDDHAEIAYSMLTGDKNGLPMEIADYFRASGLAHILAVSGLHIGFLTMILMWLMKKVKAKKIVIFVVITAALVGYVFVADFSPSVIRAAIMGIVGLVTSLTGKPRDTLNNLAFSACVILLAKPLYLFDIGFLMSVSAVLGIILFALPITKILAKIKFPRFLASGIAIPLSAQLGILPTAVYFFRSISVYSVMANVLLMYVIMATFILLIIGVTVTAFLPFAGLIIKCAGYGMFIIDSAAKLIAALPLARFIVFSVLPVFVCYIIYFVSSRFLRKDKLPKVISAACMAACAVIVACGNYSYNINNIITPVYTENYDVTTIVTVDNSVYVIGDLQNSSDTVNALVAVRARRIDAVFVNKLNEKTVRQIIELQYVYKGFTVYFPMTENMSGLDLILDKVEIQGFEESKELTNKIHGEYDNGKFLCYRMENEISALFFGLDADTSKAPYALIGNADIIRSHGYVYDYRAFATYFINTCDDSTAYDDGVIAMAQHREYILYDYKAKRTKIVN